jgi:hypothetical protein
MIAVGSFEVEMEAIISINAPTNTTLELDCQRFFENRF